MYCKQVPNNRALSDNILLQDRSLILKTPISYLIKAFVNEDKI
jgi:hypothetical protein